MKKKRLAIFLLIIGVLAGWSWLIYNASPQGIVEKLGVHNSYLILALVAFLGGTSILIPFPYYILTISFGAAGLNPILLGIFAGVGLLIGDSTTYFIAYKTREVAPKKFSKTFKNLFERLARRHPSLLMAVAFLYAAIIPLPDDIVMISAGLAEYSFWRIVLAMGFGKIIFNTILAFSGLYGWGLIAG